MTCVFFFISKNNRINWIFSSNAGIFLYVLLERAGYLGAGCFFLGGGGLDEKAAMIIDKQMSLVLNNLVSIKIHVKLKNKKCFFENSHFGLTNLFSSSDLQNMKTADQFMLHDLRTVYYIFEYGLGG